MTVADILNQAKKFAADNAPAILTGVSVAGVVGTAYLTAKASFRAAELLTDAQVRLDLNEKSRPLEPKEKVQICWRLYIPAAGLGALTIVSMISSNRISDKRAAALATAVSVGDRLFSEYKEKVKEKIGENKERDIQDEIAQDRVNANPPSSTQVIVTGGGDHLCYDLYSGRYFLSNMEALRKAQNDTNYQILGDSYASLTDFYNRIGLRGTEGSDEVGWTADSNQLELEFSAVLSDDQKPCLAFRFNVRPFRGYWHGHR
jgi:hypothetical protein